MLVNQRDETAVSRTMLDSSPYCLNSILMTIKKYLIILLQHTILWFYLIIR